MRLPWKKVGKFFKKKQGRVHGVGFKLGVPAGCALTLDCTGYCCRCCRISESRGRVEEEERGSAKRKANALDDDETKKDMKPKKPKSL